MSACKLCNKGAPANEHEHCGECSRGFRTSIDLENHFRQTGHSNDEPDFSDDPGMDFGEGMFEEHLGSYDDQTEPEDDYESLSQHPRYSETDCKRCSCVFETVERLEDHIEFCYAQSDLESEVGDKDDLDLGTQISDEEEEIKEYMSDVSEYIPDKIQTWDPFPNSDAYIETDERNELRSYVGEFNATNDWNEKYDVTVSQILKPFLDQERTKYSGLAERELQLIFKEAQALPHLPTDGARYFCNEYHTVISESTHGCQHEQQCWCYFEASPSAGIPGLAVVGQSMRKDRRACIAFIHNLLVQLLIFLTEYELQNFDDDEKWLLYNAIGWNNPQRAEDDAVEEIKDERLQYLTNDSKFQAFSMGKFDLEGEGERTENDPLFLRFCGMLGRRTLALAVCRIGDGHQFVKKQPLHYWNMTSLVSQSQRIEKDDSYDEHLKQNPRHNVELPRYPTRVIDTHTYEFEEDTALFQNDYAILSHTWTQRGREVTYQDAEAVFIEYRIDLLRTQLKALDNELGIPRNITKMRMKEAKEFLDVMATPERQALKEQLTVLEAARAKLLGQDNRHALVKVHKSEHGRVDHKALVLAQSKDPGKTKLLKAISEARGMGYHYLWVDSCCINKHNNTELVEAISSMGDWYKNSQTCLVYIDDFTGTSITELKNNRKAAKNRYATRGWTLQEIVMSPSAHFFNKHWQYLGSSRNEGYRDDIARICRIPPNMLCCGGVPDVGASLILQLATERRTFKPEDRAYSLMGILGVRIRADYGEGQAKAMSRLFESVIRTTSDVSIFNWSGKFAACSEKGRSMYPTDFDGYGHIASWMPLHYDESDFAAGYYETASQNHDYITADEVKPAHALGSITLDHFGVHARFDICEMDVLVEGHNDKTLQVIRGLEDRLRQEPNTEGKNGIANVSCSFQCEFRFVDRTSISAGVLCTVSTLKDYLQYKLASGKNSPLKWVMARFAGVLNSNWFLCEMRMQDEFAKDAIFANALQNTGIGGNEIGSFMHYLESSGFPARRIPMSYVSQSGFPKERRLFRSVYLWVG